MARAVEGCRITRDGGSSGSITYVEVCEQCGKTGQQHSGAANNNISGSFTCKNCGNRQRIRISKD